MDTAGNKATSAAASITVNNTSTPTVSILSPASGAIVSGMVTVSASASDSSGIASVQFQVDGANLGGAISVAPYSQSWSTTAEGDGPHTLTAIAISTDSSQQPASASETVTVNHSTSGPFLSTTPGWHIIPGTSLAGGPENSTLCVPDNYNNYNFTFTSTCIEAYLDSNSAIADTLRNRLIIWGGGHSGYKGNDVFSLELNNIGTSKPALIRLDDPANPNAPVGSSTTIETLAACNFSSGCTPTTETPGSRHTYDGIVYLPATDEMFTFAGATTPNGNSSSTSWKLKMSSVLASCTPSCDPQWTNLNITNVPGQVDVIMSYDPNTGGVWMVNQNNFWYFDTTTNQWTKKGNAALGYHSISVLDPEDKLFIMIGPQSTSPPEGILYFDISKTSTFTQTRPTTTNCGGVTGGPNSQYQGVIWDPVGHRVVIYPNGGNILYYLDPKTWTCTSETYGSVQGTNYPQNPPIPSGDSGTFKRFNYFPSFDVFVMCNDPKKDCWYLRPNR